MNKNDFKKNKYTIIRKAISEEISDFLYKYLLLKRRVAKTFFDKRFISPYAEYFGIWTDDSVPNTYSHYADIAMETLLVKLHPIMEKTVNLKLNPNYSYTRIYKKGDVLKRHKDRFSCEISTTLFLGGDEWPIFLSPNKNVGIPDGKKITTKSNAKGVKVNLKQGDMLIYRGSELEHWREEFKGENCAQVFLHYNNLEAKGAKENLFDGRIHLGVPLDNMFLVKNNI
jgi:hypothetical protein